MMIERMSKKNESKWYSGAANAMYEYVAAPFHRPPRVFFFFNYFILGRMGKNKALAHHIFTYFHTRRVSI